MGTEQKNEWQQREVGALWKRKSGSGQSYLSGHVTLTDELGTEKKVKVICFSNKFKSENEKAPDLRVYLQTDEKGESNSGGGATATANSQENEELLV
jgi:uncharacterized protein (DUF736 family)